MKKENIVEFKPGYHEWQLVVNDEIATTISSSTIDDIVYDYDNDRPATKEEIYNTISAIMEFEDGEDWYVPTILTDSEKLKAIELIADTLYNYYVG